MLSKARDNFNKRIGLNFFIESFYFIIVSVRKSRLKDRWKVASNVTGEQAPARYTVFEHSLEPHSRRATER